MYTTLACFFITCYIFFVFGYGTILILKKNDLKNYNFFDYYFIGLCSVGCLLNVWSIFLPTNIYALLLLLLLSIFLTIKQLKTFKLLLGGCLNYFKKNKMIFGLLILTTIIVLLFAVTLPRNYDSYLYHINAIQWIEKYRVVPGLTNFHDRFGLNSTMFVLSACFSFTEIYNQYFFIISSLTYLIFFFWLLKNIVEKKSFVGLFLLLFLYFFTEQYYLDISSPGTDLLPNILVAYVLLSLLIENDVLQKKYLFYIIITFFCLTLKLSTLPIVLIGLLASYTYSKNIFLSLKQLFIYAVLILFPWMIRNVFLTGYIVYPLDSIDLFNFDWKVSRESVIEIKKWIYSWGRIPFKDCNEVLKMSIKEWFPIWWANALPKNQYFFILSALSPILLGIYYLSYKKENNLIPILSIIVTFIGFGFWFFTSPDIRFSFSFLIILSCFPIFIFKNIIENLKKYFNPILIFCLFYSFYLISQDGYKLFCEDYSSINKVSKYFYLPKDSYYVKQSRNIQFKSFIVLTPKGQKVEIFEPTPNHSQCFDKFPCSWYINNNVKLRGENLQNGFKNN